MSAEAPKAAVEDLIAKVVDGKALEAFDLAELVEPMLVVRRTLREQIVILHRRLLAIVRDDEVCRRLMTTPGVDPVAGDLLVPR